MGDFIRAEGEECGGVVVLLEGREEGEEGGGCCGITGGKGSRKEGGGIVYYTRDTCTS